MPTDPRRVTLAVPRSYIPSDLAYGDRGRPPKIPKNAVLVFVMEIVKIQGAKVPAAPRGWSES